MTTDNLTFQPIPLGQAVRRKGQLIGLAVATPEGWWLPIRLDAGVIDEQPDLITAALALSETQQEDG